MQSGILGSEDICLESHGAAAVGYGCTSAVLEVRLSTTMENTHATQACHQDPMLDLRRDANIRETGGFRCGRWDGYWRARTVVLYASSTGQGLATD